jgi:hypothetical protein
MTGTPSLAKPTWAKVEHAAPTGLADLTKSTGSGVDRAAQIWFWPAGKS